MKKKILIEKAKNQDLIEVWEHNRKGFYNFKSYLPLNNKSLIEIRKQYKNYIIIDKGELLKKIDNKKLVTETGILINR